jgi:pre-rRNA-processing protein IPI3
LGNKNLTGRSVLAFSGSEDGTVRVWELRSRQPLRVIAVADRAPVTGLLVLDRPPLLAAGQGRRQGASPSPAADPRGAAYLHAVAYAQQGSS